MISKHFKAVIIAKLHSILKTKGFKKSGNIFSLSNDDLTYFINFQSSNSTSSITLKLTLNIEIHSSLIYRLENTSLPEKWSRHFSKRIGFFLDTQNDKWWLIENDAAANVAANEIEHIILNKVLPEFNSLKTTNDLANLWRQNKCPGLTEGQRKEYLSLLAGAPTV